MNRKKNIYLIAGGGGRKPDSIVPVFRQVLAESEKTVPRVAYIGAANGDHPGFYSFMKDAMEKAGSCAVEHVVLSGKKADVSAVRSALAGADMVFISGGDVLEGMAVLDRYHLAPFLKGLYEDGKVFFGISAGSIMLGARWVNWDDPGDDSSAALFDCIGIAPVVCDTHAEDDDWEELKRAVELMDENSAGYGIPSGGTIMVSPDGKLSALGKSSVVYVNKKGVPVMTGETVPA